MMTELGSDRRYEAEALRRATNGRNFRSTASILAAEAGANLDSADLEYWVAEERRAVTAHLARALKPDPSVAAALRALSRSYALAVVSSSAAERVRACLQATGLDDLFAADRLFSAEDSLPEPRSKPSPAVYLHAIEALGISGEQAVAVEDAVPGVVSAAAAGIPVIGLLAFVPEDERDEREAELRAEGAHAVVESWEDAVELLADERAGAAHA
jgi:HAD superfamily hydrolase (TIGR01509 family)